MNLENAPFDLLQAKELVYDSLGLVLTNFSLESESQEYNACRFQLNNHRIIFRTAKITPTKIGQFVTFWKREENGPIMPFDLADPIDFFVMSVRNGKSLGQFVFPREVLLKHGVISKDGRGGKRALRVYPAWDSSDSEQAKRTQSWQLNYFYEIRPNFEVDTCKSFLL